jgi:hypothetical protein
MVPRWPAEWERHERTWMAWPHGGYSLGDTEAEVEEARRAWSTVANTIVKYEPVSIVVDPSAVQAASGFEALRFPSDWTGGWHNSPHRQWGFILSGAVAVTTSDGASCELRAGGAFLLEDVHGKGHLTRVIGGTEVLWVAVQIPGDVVPLTA